MDHSVDNQANCGFDTFISYSRKNVEFAKRLEKSLGNFIPPKVLAVPHQRLTIFRDENDLVGADYYGSIDRYLQQSRKLIVICSPAALQPVSSSLMK